MATRGEFGERLKGGVLENSVNGDECSENSVGVARRLAGVTDRIGAVTEGSVPGTIDLPRSLNLGLSDPFGLVPELEGANGPAAADGGTRPGISLSACALLVDC